MIPKAIQEQLAAEVNARAKNIEIGVTLFAEAMSKQFNDEIELVDNAADKITDFYYSIIWSNYKPFVKDRIEACKVASAMEMAIVLVKPVIKSKVFTTVEANAIFAMHLATVFSVGLKEWDLGQLDFPNKEFEVHFANIMTDHKLMIESIIASESMESFPLSSNAQFWKLIDFVFQIRKNIQYHP